MQTVKKNCGQGAPLSAQLGRGSQDSRSETTEKSNPLGMRPLGECPGGRETSLAGA